MAKFATAGERRHKMRPENPGQPVPDGDGGFTSTWTPLVPATVYASLEQATAWNLERMTAGTTVQSSATHIVAFPYHPQVTTKTRLVYGSRIFMVTGVVNPSERNIDTVCVVTEVVP